MPLSIGIIKNISTADTANEIVSQAHQEGKRAVAVQTDGGWSIRITKKQNRIEKFLGAITGQNIREQSRLANFIASLPTIASLRDRSAQLVAQRDVAEFKSSESSGATAKQLSEAIARAWPTDSTPAPQAAQSSPKAQPANPSSESLGVDLNALSRSAFNEWQGKNIHIIPLEVLWDAAGDLDKKGNFIRSSQLYQAITREYAHQELGTNQELNQLSAFARNQWADQIAKQVSSVDQDGSRVSFNTLKQRIAQKVTLVDNGININDA
jgi:hypothetical protein